MRPRMVSSGMRSSRSNIASLRVPVGCAYSSPAGRFALAARARPQIPEQERGQTATLAAPPHRSRYPPVTARIPVAIAALLAAGSVAIAAPGAQEGSTQTHSARAHAHAAQGAAATPSAAGEKAQASYSLG